MCRLARHQHDVQQQTTSVLLQQLGVDLVIDYAQQRPHEAVLAYTDGRGADRCGLDVQARLAPAVGSAGGQRRLLVQEGGGGIRQ